MEDTGLKLHPEWRDAANVITARVEIEGYGIIITHHDLRSLFDMKPDDPERRYTLAEVNKIQFAFLQNIEALKDYLLESENIYLLSIRGIGYQVLNPSDQINVTFKKYMDKIQRIINKAVRALICVDETLLSNDDHGNRLKRIERLAFLKGATRRKQLAAAKDAKLIENKEQD